MIQNNSKEPSWNTRKCIKETNTDSDRKLKATFCKLSDHLDKSEILANLRGYRGWNSKTLGAKTSTIQHTELKIWFFLKCSAENCNFRYGHEIKDIQNGLNLAFYLDSIKH